MRSTARRTLVAAVMGFAWLTGFSTVDARVVSVTAREGALSRALERAAPGDTIQLERGVHPGRMRLATSVTLRGEPGAVLDGGGEGSALTIVAPGTVVENLEIRGSGRRVITVDSGVRAISAPGLVLRNLRFRDVLYGVSAERSDDLRIEACDLVGRVRPLDESGDGNGLHLWYCHHPILLRNQVTRFADGIYLSFVDDARVEGGRFHDNGRYGLHTMYCQRTHLLTNEFAHNVAGIAIMFSNDLRVERNWMVHNRGPRTYGLLLRDCSAGRFEGNQLIDNTVAMFMDNSNRNRVVDNRLEDNGWGVILFSSCAGNEFSGNDFINDDYPLALDMRHTDNRFDDGHRGNYWSGSAPYDLNGDGVSDVPYSPVSAFAFISKQYPDLSVLARSPAVVALSVAERVFPSLQPSEALDRFPRVRPSASSLAQGREHLRARRSWPAVGVFGVLLALGLVTVVRRRGPS